MLYKLRADQASVRPVLVLVLLWRFFLLRWLRLLLFLLPLLFLRFLLLALLHFLLLLIVFVLHLLELLLLALLRLLLALLVGLLLLEFLVLLDLLLFELLALLILLFAQVIHLLLLVLLRLRICTGSRSRRTIVEIAVVIVRTIVRLRLWPLIWLVGRPIVVVRLLVFGLRLLRNILLRPVVRLRLWRLILLARAIGVLLSWCRRLILLSRTVCVGLSLCRLVRLIRPRRNPLALRRQLRLASFLHHADIIARLIVLAHLGDRHRAAAVGLHLF